jgi:hypothetical protein
MLFEVFFGVVQIALCLGGKHIHFLAHSTRKSCNEFVTTRLLRIGLDGGMSPTLNRHFLWHALPLTVVRTFASEDYPKAGGDSSEVHPISARNLSDFYPMVYER